MRKIKLNNGFKKQTIGNHISHFTKKIKNQLALSLNLKREKSDIK